MTLGPSAADWGRLVKSLGVPAAIALLLVWWLTTVVHAQLTALRTDHGQILGTQRALQHYLRAICLHTATTESQRAACIYQDPPPPDWERGR